MVGEKKNSLTSAAEKFSVKSVVREKQLGFSSVHEVTSQTQKYKTVKLKTQNKTATDLRVVNT